MFLRLAGLRPVVVHGGGPQIKAMLDRLGLDSEFKGGLRVTTPEVMDVVRMVLTGQVGRELVGLLNAARADRGRALRRGRRAVRRPPPRRTSTARSVDIGLVGDVVEVDPTAVLDLLEAGRIPVVSTIAPDLDVDGQVLNVNADTAAAALAAALGAAQARRAHRRRGRLRRLARPRLAALRASVRRPGELLHTVEAGMIPKLEACVRAVRGRGAAGSRRRRPPAALLLLEVFTSDGIGTMVLPGPAARGGRP